MSLLHKFVHLAKYVFSKRYRRWYRRKEHLRSTGRYPNLRIEILKFPEEGRRRMPSAYDFGILVDVDEPLILSSTPEENSPKVIDSLFSDLDEVKRIVEESKNEEE